MWENITFDNIIHISDIHICKKFNTRIIGSWKYLYSYLFNNYASKKILIVISGDIFDNCNNFCGDDIRTFNKILNDVESSGFIKMLTISGNHDIDSANNDVIELIINDNYSNIIHFSGTMNSQVGSNLFIYSMYFKDKEFPNIINKNSNMFYICIGHGLFEETNVQNRSGEYRYTYADIPTKFDIVMFGDSHKTIYKFVNKKTHFTYAGSFIQTKVNEFYIRNYFIYDLNNFKKPSLHYLVSYNSCPKITSNADYDKLIKYLPFVQIPSKIRIFNNIEKEKLNNILNIWPDITVLDICSKKHNLIINDDAFSDNYYNVECTNSWTIDYLEWQNLFIYSNDTVYKLDFNKLDDSKYLLCGANASGKSSIINILLFMIFKNNISPNNAINNNSDDGYALLGFKVNDKHYELGRFICKNKNETYLKNITDSIFIVNKDKDMLKNCYNEFYNLIGIPDFKILTQISIAQQTRKYINYLTQSERISIFNSILGLDEFRDKLDTYVNDRIALIKQTDMYAKNIETIETTFKTNNIIIDDLEQEELKLQELAKSYIKSESSLRFLNNDELENIIIKYKHINVKNKQQAFTNSDMTDFRSIENYINNINKYKPICIYYNKKINLIELDNLSHNYKKYKNISIVPQKHKLKQIQQINIPDICAYYTGYSVELLQSMKFYNDCNMCIRNRDLISSGEKYKKYREQYEENIYISIDNAKIRHETTFKYIQYTGSNCMTYKCYFTNTVLNELIDTINKHINVMNRFNVLLPKLIYNVSTEINNRKQIQGIPSDIIEKTTFISKMVELKKSYIKHLALYDDMIKKTDKLENDIASIKKNICEIFDHRFKTMLTIMNDILKKLNTYLYLDQIILNNTDAIKNGKKCVDIKVTYKKNNINLNALSGYQSFVLDMIFRMVSQKMSIYNLPSVMIIDEGLGSVDVDNMVNIEKLLDAFNKYLPNCTLLLISHIKPLFEYSEMSIEDLII